MLVLARNGDTGCCCTLRQAACAFASVCHPCLGECNTDAYASDQLVLAKGLERAAAPWLFFLEQAQHMKSGTDKGPTQTATAPKQGLTANGLN